ncbi:MAG: hypothetical protein WCO55_01435 [Candidatus Falkowbacteria bacterium]
MPVEKFTQPKKPDDSEQITNSLGLFAGKHLSLVKNHAQGPSALDVGHQLKGELKRDVKVGSPVEFTNGGNTSNVQGIAQVGGKYFIKTATSIYEIQISAPENIKSRRLTKADLDAELKIYDTKGYGEWDLTNNRVPKEDDPYRLFLVNNGIEVGDEVKFFSDGKERSGKVDQWKSGSLSIRDTNGNMNGIFAILNSPGSYIEKV